MSINKDIKKNHVIKSNDLETKKPGGQGINSKDYLRIIEKKKKK